MTNKFKSNSLNKSPEDSSGFAVPISRVLNTFLIYSKQQERMLLCIIYCIIGSNLELMALSVTVTSDLFFLNMYPRDFPNRIPISYNPLKDS